MSYLHFNHTRIRERTPDYEPRAQVPRESNERRRDITLSDIDDDGHDDYPYSYKQKAAKMSRALTVREEPSQLERYNVWSDNRHNEDDEERRRSYETRRTYKYSSDRIEDEDADDRGFRFSFKTSFERPHSSHRRHSLFRDFDAHSWPSDVLLRRKDKWVDEAWESRERSASRERSLTRRDSCCWGELEEKEKEIEDEKWSRYRRTTVSKTEELRPLSSSRRRKFIRDV
ncbi:hypothetical protein GMOD_00007123 [Pyrenophora seminiperda CCB06]|uniref:Uncharacterized protein n=1 Tax=Pyrenophora seminiperda CCB06 TaxID=1302712 RepID=A0A3M7MC86_9PLEO|nr:hypothetical protein GMOD_00007123 [Pyrenophora seminiperda CCB06]